MSILREVLTILALMFSLGTAILAVWIFDRLRTGHIIVPDAMNGTEFWMAISILALTVVALIVNLLRLKETKSE